MAAPRFGRRRRKELASADDGKVLEVDRRGLKVHDSETGGVDIRTAEQGIDVARIGGVWRASRPIHRGLRPFVRGYAGFWDAVAIDYRVRAVPLPYVVMMIALGEPFSDFRRLESSTPGSGPIGSLVAGLTDGPRAVEHPGGKEVIRLDLTPLGASRLFALPMAEVANQVVELRDVLGVRAGELTERLAGLRSWTARFDLLDAALLARAADSLAPAPEVSRAWRLLSDSAGTIPIARVAAEVGWSQPHLTRRFTHQVGLTPKSSARILRFNRALEMLARADTPLAEISAACGFYDQSHLCHDFRDLAGIAPSLMMATRSEEGDFVL